MPPISEPLHAPSSILSQPVSSAPDDAVVGPNPIPLQDTCADIHARVTAFLDSPTQDEDDTVRRTQEQARFSIGVITKALDDYGYVSDHH